MRRNTSFASVLFFYLIGIALWSLIVPNSTALDAAPFKVHPRVISQLSDSRLGELAGKITPEKLVDLANSDVSASVRDSSHPI